MFMSGPNKTVLASTLKTIGMPLNEVWVTPAALCGAKDGKDAKISEVKACGARIRKEVHLIQPNILVLLGNLALKAMVPKSPPNLQGTIGRIIEIDIDGDLTQYKIPAMVTYSLNYLVRNTDTNPGGLWNRFFTHIARAIHVANTLDELRSTPVANTRWHAIGADLVTIEDKDENDTD
jgi:uracil-DNA glycosylase family 4